MATQETETLTAGFIKECKKRLLRERKELDDWLAVGPPELTDHEEYERKPVLERYLSQKDQKEKRQKTVIDALARIKDGTFGRCPDCLKIIPEARLDGDPARERCCECHSRHSSSPAKTLPHWPKKTKKTEKEKLYSF